jgi:bacterial/archaeal transporter family protein
MAAQYLILISIMGWGVGSLFYKTANDNIHPIMVSAIVTCVYVILTPLAFLFFKINTHLNSAGIIASIGGGLCMCVGSLGYFFALRGGGAGAITVLTSLYPALTLILSMCFFHETISFRQGIGIALALISFIFLSGKS